MKELFNLFNKKKQKKITESMNQWFVLDTTNDTFDAYVEDYKAHKPGPINLVELFLLLNQNKDSIEFQSGYKSYRLKIDPNSDYININLKSSNTNLFHIEYY